MSKLAVIKTQQTNSSVEEYINGLANEEQKADSKAILAMMEKATGEKPRMWGKSLIGFGKIRYKSPATGREVDWFKIGFAPRKSNLSLHLITNLKGQSDLLNQLGKYKTGVGCLYINKLKDIDIKVLGKIIGIAAKQKAEVID